MVESTNPEFRVFPVIGRSLGILGSNIVPFGIVALVLVGLSTWVQRLGQQTQLVSDPMEIITTSILTVIVVLAASALTSAVLVFGSFQEMRGQHAPIGEAFGRGVSLALPVIGVVIVAGALTMLGFFLLVIPGIIVAMVLYVVIPAAVIERTGVIGSLKRSAFLTRGNRSKLLGLTLLVIIAQGIVNLILWLILGEEIINSGLVRWFIDSAVTMIWAVIVCVAYHDLRLAKEGVDAREIAKVFD